MGVYGYRTSHEVTKRLCLSRFAQMCTTQKTVFRCTIFPEKFPAGNYPSDYPTIKIWDCPCWEYYPAVRGKSCPGWESASGRELSCGTVIRGELSVVGGGRETRRIVVNFESIAWTQVMCVVQHGQLGSSIMLWSVCLYFSFFLLYFSYYCWNPK